MTASAQKLKLVTRSTVVMTSTVPVLAIGLHRAHNGDVATPRCIFYRGFHYYSIFRAQEKWGDSLEGQCLCSHRRHFSLQEKLPQQQRKKMKKKLRAKEQRQQSQMKYRLNQQQKQQCRRQRGLYPYD